MRLIALLVLLTAASAPLAQNSPATVAQLLTQSLPNIEGKEVAMVTVEYAPGATSAAHRHNANTFVYVLEGAIEMQVAGGKLQTLSAGQTFYESPSDIHAVSRNASKTQKAKFLVFFIKEKGAPATVPVN